jgi:hypothetical protein
LQKQIQENQDFLNRDQAEVKPEIVVTDTNQALDPEMKIKKNYVRKTQDDD